MSTNSAPAARKILKAAKVDVATQAAGWGAIVKGSNYSPAVTIEFRTMGSNVTARKARAALVAAGWTVRAYGYGGKMLANLDSDIEVVKSLYVTP